MMRFVKEHPPAGPSQMPRRAPAVPCSPRHLDLRALLHVVSNPRTNGRVSDVKMLRGVLCRLRQ
jgi:hypothetical protein